MNYIEFGGAGNHVQVVKELEYWKGRGDLEHFGPNLIVGGFELELSWNGFGGGLENRICGGVESKCCLEKKIRLKLCRN